MKRFFAAIALACVGLAGSGAGAVTVDEYYSFSFNYFSGPIGAAGMIFTQVDRLTGSVVVAGGFVCSFSPASSCQSGPFVVDADPLGVTATVTGTVGPMTVNLQFLMTHVTTNVPYIDAEVVPGGSPQATAYMSDGRQGRTNGTITSTNGVVTVVDAYTSMGIFLPVTAP